MTKYCGAYFYQLLHDLRGNNTQAKSFAQQTYELKPNKHGVGEWRSTHDDQ